MSSPRYSVIARHHPLLPAREQRGNIICLTLTQALAGANAVVAYATEAIIGHTLAPSFFTGRLITHFETIRVVITGLLLTGLSAVVNLLVVDISHFWLTLILLGIGWNFGFIGASSHGAGLPSSRAPVCSRSMISSFSAP